MKNHVIDSGRGYKIFLDEICHDSVKPKAILILVHGFKGFKDWGFFPYVADFFAKNGFHVFKFNFSHNGISGNSSEFTEFDKFAQNTFSLENEELHEVIDWVKEYTNKQLKISLLGHSRGGGQVLLSASQRTDLNKVITWSAVASFDRYSKETKQKWRKNGFISVTNSRTGQVFKMNQLLLDDLEKNAEQLNIFKACSKIQYPCLIAHGKQDVAVDFSDSEKIVSALPNPSHLPIESAGHTFNIKHPFENSSKELDFLLERSLAFLDK